MWKFHTADAPAASVRRRAAARARVAAPPPPVSRYAKLQSARYCNATILYTLDTRATWPAARPSGDCETLSISGPYSGPTASPHPLSSPQGWDNHTIGALRQQSSILESMHVAYRAPSGSYIKVQHPCMRLACGLTIHHLVDSTSTLCSSPLCKGGGPHATRRLGHAAVLRGRFKEDRVVITLEWTTRGGARFLWGN